MNITEHLLTCVAEECSEIAKDACKALRFGPTDFDPKDCTNATNMQRMVIEANDLIAVIDMLAEHHMIPRDWYSKSQQDAKKFKVNSLFAYAVDKGALQL